MGRQFAPDESLRAIITSWAVSLWNFICSVQKRALPLIMPTHSPVLSDEHLHILQSLDNEIPACVHTHAYTAAVLAARNFVVVAARLVGASADDH
jgi:hypothetical protein